MIGGLNELFIFDFYFGDEIFSKKYALFPLYLEVEKVMVGECLIPSRKY